MFDAVVILMCLVTLSRTGKEYKEIISYSVVLSVRGSETAMTPFNPCRISSLV